LVMKNLISDYSNSCQQFMTIRIANRFVYGSNQKVFCKEYEKK